MNDNVKQPNSLKVAIVQACKLEGETMGVLAAELKKLTVEDLKWFAERFEVERGWKFPEPTSAFG